jgi:hypothetical protein
MTISVRLDNSATVEHLKDKWASKSHRKIEDENNVVAACFKCNNTRGNKRNVIARKYYQCVINQKNLKLKAASISSSELYKLFGPVPQHLFNE